MSTNYTPRAFFRHMPNALLARYFQERGIFGDLDFAAMKETKPDLLFGAWLGLPEQQRKVVDTEFQDILGLSSESGFKAIIDEANWQLRETPDAIPPLIEKLSALPSHAERAMITFLDHREFWKGATRFHHADTLPYWRKRKHMGNKPAAVDQATLDTFAAQIGAYFHKTEGRGANCIVEPYRRSELDYFFAYPEDYSQQAIEWVDGEFGRRPHNPAFEVIFVYSQKEGSLDLNLRGSRKAVEPLQGIFATTILGLDALPPDPKDERVYDLNLLGKKSFTFTHQPGSGISSVVVKKLRLSSRFRKGERLTLEADTGESPVAVYDLVERISQAVPLRQYHVSQVEIAATVVVDVDKPPKVFTIRLTHPNSCSLKYDELGLTLRAMLEASGIEPKEPTEPETALEDIVQA